MDHFTFAQAQNLYGSLIGDLESVRVEHERLTRRKTGLQGMLDSLLMVHPEVATHDQRQSAPEGLAGSRHPSTAGRPKGVSSVDAVVTVVTEDHEGRSHVSVRSVMDGLDKRGWLPDASDTEAAVRTALSRATSQGRLERAKIDGRSSGYRPKDAESPASTGDSDTPAPTREEGGGSHETATTSPGEVLNDLHLGASGTLMRTGAS